MIWRDHKIIFLHLPRCGGTSLEIVLSGGDPTEKERQEGVWNKHFDAYRAEAFWPEFHANDYRVIAFVRDPVQTIASQYIQNTANPTVVGFNAFLRRSMKEGSPLYLTSAEVDDYLQDLCPKGAESAGASQMRFFKTRTTRQIEFFPYDRINEAIRKIGSQIGVKLPRKIIHSGQRILQDYSGLPRTRGKINYKAMFDTEVLAQLRDYAALDFEFYSTIWKRTKS
ncbi:hypothetical protein EBZ80_14295 [bacterium]|nr:hypothetical protein [bacterium]